MRNFISTLFMVFGLLIGCKSQTVTNDKSSSFSLNEITYYSSKCNGTCPDISMNIYGDKRIEISREVFNKKGQSDSILSGNFKGYLTDEEFKKLIGFLEKINWDTLTYSKVFCCDGAIKTISLSYNDKYKRIKSMTLPQSTIALSNYLTYLATKISVPKYDKPIDFEIYED